MVLISSPRGLGGNLFLCAFSVYSDGGCLYLVKIFVLLVGFGNFLCVYGLIGRVRSAVGVFRFLLWLVGLCGCIFRLFLGLFLVVFGVLSVY